MLQRLLLLLLSALAAGPRTVSPFVLEGSQTSYAQFRRWAPSPSSSSSISLEFLTSQPNGVLLYADDGGYYDFLELKLVEGAARLRFSLGEAGDARALQAGSGLADGDRWHRVEVRWDGDVVALDVDGQCFRVILVVVAAAHCPGCYCRLIPEMSDL